MLTRKIPVEEDRRDLRQANHRHRYYILKESWGQPHPKYKAIQLRPKG